MNGLFFVLILFGSLALAREVHRTKNVPSRETGDISFHAGIALLLGAILARFLILDLLRRNGFILFTMDEASRWHLSWIWSRSPYFFTSWDGVWLTGGFAYYGAWMRLLGNPALGAHAGATVAAVATLASAYFLARVLSRRHWIAALAAWLFAPAYHFLWYGHGVLAESLLAGLAMCALAFALLWFEAGEPRVRLRLAAAAALFIFLASTVHYVAWMAFAVGLLVLLIALIKSKKIGSHGATAMLIFSSGIVFPACWLAASRRVLGHPLAFLANQKNVMAELGSQYAAHDSVFSNLLQFPAAFAAQAGLLLLPLLILLGAAAKNPRLRGGIGFLAGFAAALLFLMSLLVAGNFYGLPDRNTTIVQSFAFVLIALAFGAVPQLWRGFRSLLFAGLVAIGLGWFGYNALKANRFEQAGASQLDTELVALANWLKLQARRPDVLTRFNPDSIVGFCDFHYADENLLLLEFLSGVPGRLVMIPPEYLTGAAFPHHDYVISSLNVQPGDYRLIHTFGKWRIYEPAPP